MKLIKLLIIILFTGLAYAESGFDLAAANKRFDAINIKLSIQDLQLKDLSVAVSELEQLQMQARACIHEAGAQLKLLENSLKGSVPGADFDYLNQKKLLYTKRLSECRLFVFRSDEAITAYQTVIQQLSTSALLERTESIIQTWQQPWGEINLVWQFQFKYFLQLLFASFIGLFMVIEFKLSRGILAVGVLALALGVGHILGKTQANTAVVTMGQVTYSVIITSGLGLLAWAWKRHLWRWLSSLILVSVLVVEFMGYSNLVQFILHGFIKTLTGLAGVGLLIQITQWLIHQFRNPQYLFVRQLRYWLGLRRQRILYEMDLLRIVLYGYAVYWTLIFLVDTWGGSDIFIDQLISGLHEGFSIAGLLINPSQIIVAILVFSVLHMMARLIATLVARQHQFEGEVETQVAVASIINYAGFAMALIMGLLSAGFNFTSLAIIAGALSVGIGFGLQNIVNNMISGFILLLEKPIKPGDRIIIGNTEGFVKQIRLRATQILTQAREDVIIPNADLISQQVTNFMYRDKYWRVVCRVGVAYGSDVEQVEQLLLQVANEHPDVIDDSPHEPEALFREFGDSSLKFELWAIIKNVNNKNRQHSELNFAIEKIFRDNNIHIPFPQRDVHMIDKDH